MRPALLLLLLAGALPALAPLAAALPCVVHDDGYACAGRENGLGVPTLVALRFHRAWVSETPAAGPVDGTSTPVAILLSVGAATTPARGGEGALEAHAAVKLGRSWYGLPLGVYPLDTDGDGFPEDARVTPMPFPQPWPGTPTGPDLGPSPLPPARTPRIVLPALP